MIFGNRDDKERVYLNALKTANTYNLKVLAVMVFLSILALVLDEIGVFVKRKGATENEGGSGYVTSALVYSDGTYATYESLFGKQ